MVGASNLTCVHWVAVVAVDENIESDGANAAPPIINSDYQKGNLEINKSLTYI